ncbi:MAG TPA: FAD-binding oxidoreductase [Ilumatobacteraceae bacterium]|nr:FAD-binding oxidoreductase [Ilumatobacteraceae bacterium]
MRSTRRELSGWGRTSPSVADVLDVSADELTADLLAGFGNARGAIARGLGRAYGDSAQNAGGSVVRLAPGPILLDPSSGTVRVGAGVSLDELMRHVVPRGWFVPVTPGTRFVTVGGAIASDIHGKNHHADGSFGEHVDSFVLLTADGDRRVVTPHDEADLWWATIGGMGLTGVVTEATVRLLPIETSRCVVDTERVPNLDSLLERMESGDHRYR